MAEDGGRERRRKRGVRERVGRGGLLSLVNSSVHSSSSLEKLRSRLGLDGKDNMHTRAQTRRMVAELHQLEVPACRASLSARCD